MSFVPFRTRIHFEPITEESIIHNDSEKYVKKGKVLAVGADVLNIKEGDVISFLEYGAEVTPDGEWTVLENDTFIMGYHV